MPDPGGAAGDVDATALNDRNRLPLVQRSLLTVIFCASGFCGLLYQVVWLRLAFASFGITTTVLSVVVSVFMLGLAVGSWLGGRVGGAVVRRGRPAPAMVYAAAELTIALSALVVPALFAASAHALLGAGDTDSLMYRSFAGLLIAASLFPWCVCMGATFPLMIAHWRQSEPGEQSSFSFLYTANVLGAMIGTLATALILIELLGLRHTLWVAGTINVLIAVAAVGMAGSSSTRALVEEVPSTRQQAPSMAEGRMDLWLLAATGFSCMAMEVVWNRMFTPVLGTQVYSFALLLFVYLLATWAGSARYRKRLAAGQPGDSRRLVAWLPVVMLLPALVNDPRFIHGRTLQALIGLVSIVPFCAALGMLTPQLIDSSGQGDPKRAGFAYSINISGCVLGPLVASYLLLPWLGAELSLVLLTAPFLMFTAVVARAQSQPGRSAPFTAAVICLFAAAMFTSTYEDPCARGSAGCVIRRDSTATVVTVGKGFGKQLYVNGSGMTMLTPITKFMAHLPLSMHKGKPTAALAICFGMGTTFRSLLTWDIDVTAVELVPSVRSAFTDFHTNANDALRNPRGRIVVDDGRRFLSRSNKTFDLITIDPPPPVEAAGSSLLYSSQFIELAKAHLKPGGILLHWYPRGDPQVLRVVAATLADHFPYIRVFRSVEGWGYHLMASMEPVTTVTPETMLAAMPPAARADLTEWTTPDQGPAMISKVVDRELPIESFTSGVVARVTDDVPYNEYFLLRRMRH